MVAQMWRKVLALMVPVITGAAFANPISAAGEPRVVNSHATAQFVPLTLGKAIVIDLPVDVAEVLVADPAIVGIVMRAARRAYLIGVGKGETNIAFYDVAHRQISSYSM